jgi:hypothetical protein
VLIIADAPPNAVDAIGNSRTRFSLTGERKGALEVMIEPTAALARSKPSKR